MDICLITGTSTGIGRATALHLARNGFKVHATMRDPAKGAAMAATAAAEKLPLEISALDVLDGDSMARAVERIERQDGRIDVLVNNAGLSSSSPFETYPEAEHRQVMEANYWGPVRLMQRLLPGMRQRQHGAIVNVTSILGRIAFGNQGAYCASKFALEAISECLAVEVAPLGVRVCIIEPGVVASAIFENTKVHYDRESPYRNVMRRNGRFYTTGVPQATPPEEIAAVIREALTTDRPRLRWLHGWGAQALARRAATSDEDYLALGALDDDAYYARLNDLLGLDLAKKA